jgi:hypothetical protein
LLAPVGLGLVIAGGESWADPAIVSPNGLTVQVNPTFPEPGLCREPSWLENMELRGRKAI